MEKIKIVKLDGNEYKLIKLPAMAQFHVARRLAGLLAPILQQNLTKYERLSAFMDKIGELEDKDAEALISQLMAQTYIQEPNGTGWSLVMPGGKLMRDDLDLSIIIMLCWESVVLNLSNFTRQISNLTAQLPSPQE